MKKLNKLFAILFAVLGVTTLKAQTDVTSQYVKNPTFTNKDNWTIKNAGTNNPAASYNCLEFWGGGNSSLYLLAHQEITNLPNGVYRLTVNAFNRSEAGKPSNVYVYANTTDKEYSVSMKTRESEKSLYGSEPNSMKDAGAAFYSTKGDYWLNTVDNIIVKDGKLDIGIRNVSQLTVNSGCWTIMGNVKLYELTGASLSPLMNNLITDARNLVAKNYQGASNLEEAILTATSIPESALNYDAIITLQSAIAKYKENSLNSVDATTSTPVDATFLIKNAGFEDGATLKESTANGGYNEPKGWTLTYGSSHTNNHIVVANTSTTHAGYGGVVTPTEGSYTLGGRMRWTNGSNEKITQTVKLPAGSYSLSVDLGFNNTGSCAFIGVIGEKTVFSAKPKATDLTTFTSDKFSVKEGEQLILTFELKQNGSSNTYAAMDNIRLMYYGDPIAALLADITLKKEKLEEFDGKIPTDIYDKYAEHLNAAASANNSMEESALQTILDNLNADIAAAEPLVSPYVNLKSLITTCERSLDKSIEFVDGAKTAFSTAVNTAKTDVEAAATADVINAIYNTLESARQTYVKQADPLNGFAFDYTFLVVNPGLDDGTKGWTSTGGAQNKAIATNKANGIITGTFFENWNPSNFTGEIYQTISNLPSGVYKLKVAAYGAGTNVYANDKQTAVTTSDGAWYEVDQVKVGDGTLKFGIKNENATNWMGIDNASLEYYGFDVATAQSAITSMVVEAEGLVGKPMNAGVASALQAAIDGADATKTTRNELSPMIEVLSKAIADAETSIAAYEAINRYIIKANGIGESIAADYLTQYNNGELTAAEPVFQALEVATYNYVTEEFSYPVALSSEWTKEGPVGELSDQHWSGEKRPYMEQSSAAWGSNAWEISYDQDLTLPAGEYVFKVAGRKASGDGCTLNLIVTKDDETLGTVNDFPEGDTGYGIDTSGAANFSDEGAYANNDKGRGWQWRYVKFTLGEAATVNIAVKAKATTNHQWISFCDATVQMTEETYLEANKGGLDAPTAAAEALVGTKPMGTAENDALQAALNMPVTTGAELLAKIDALNTAVAKANAWVAAYNEAKAPLVAALERFEADYNKDGVKMSQTVWNNVLEKVKAAALAKDVTDSYDGFAVAAEELNVALDAAQTSIDAYAALNEAIENANTTANGGNIGDQPFQRPVSAQTTLNAAIATAQAAYDAAEADVTEVKTVLDEAVEAFNNAELKAPAEGQRFYMVIDYEGWEHHGKAATYLAGDRNDAGKYNIKYYVAPNANYAQAFTFTAIEGKADCYTVSMTDVDGNERYICTGKVYGGDAYQIRTTTEADKALAIKVIATTTDGVHNLYNTEANQYIGGQDAGFYTVNSHINFNLRTADKAEVALNISDAKWSTLILPFNAELPEGVVAYSCEEVSEDGVTLNLVEVKSFKANTPYLVNGEDGKYGFTGYGLATKDSYTVGLFTGTYVDYQTEADKNIYVLQKNEAGLGFYLVGKNAQPWVRAYRCYMTNKGAGAPMFRIGEDETTSIHNSEFSTQDSAVVYDLMGRKVTNMMKGNMYIVNGKKVVVK